MNNTSTNANDEVSTGFLPVLCTSSGVLRIMAGAQVLALVLALANAPASYQEGLIQLGLTSLFVQWVMLSSTVVVCFFVKKLNKLDIYSITAWVSLIIVIFTISASVLATMVMSLNNEAILKYWDTAFVLRNVIIALVLSCMAIHYLHVQSQREALSRAESDAKYEALQSRMKPHFLFNSLNSIAQLIEIDKTKAEDAILDLADIFRTTLDQRQHISLGEEIDLTKRYLGIEELRLGKRLNIVWDMDENILPVKMKIPPLLLQPLAENAVHHGIQPCEEGGTLGISLCDTGKGLEVLVTNPIPPDGTNAHQKGNHIAQENLKNRLRLAYGDRAKLKITKTDRQYRVSFTIPKEAA